MFFFLQLLIITFVSNVHESAAHDEVNGGIFFCIISYILDKRIFIFAYFEKINIIAYFNYRKLEK